MLTVHDPAKREDWERTVKQGYEIMKTDSPYTLLLNGSKILSTLWDLGPAITPLTLERN